MTGREEERKSLLELYGRKRAELVAVYGRRRVGKTYLIDQTFQDRFAFKHTAISPEELKKEEALALQLESFYRSLVKYGLSKEESRPKSWFDAFDLLEKLLASKGSEERQVVFLDEFPWLDVEGSNFIKSFERFWNDFGCSRNNLMLIVCGSATSWLLNKLINNRAGLYGRTTYEIKLSPLSLKQCEEILKENGNELSRYDVATAYMCLGGIPYYLNYIKSELTLAQNIDMIFFGKEAKLRFEFDRLFQSCFDRPELIKKTVVLLGKKKSGFLRGEIAEKLCVSDGGDLTKMLNALESSDIIEKYVPFGTGSKLFRYRLVDPFCLFCLHFAEERSKERFWSLNLDSQKTTVWKGLAFENVCFAHVEQIKNALRAGDVYAEASPYYDKEDGYQVDLVLKRKDNVINLCEIKFYSSEFVVSKEYSLKVNERKNRIVEVSPKKWAVRNVLISTYGLKKNEYSSVFVNSLTLDDLFIF